MAVLPIWVRLACWAAHVSVEARGWRLAWAGMNELSRRFPPNPHQGTLSRWSHVRQHRSASIQRATVPLAKASHLRPESLWEGTKERSGSRTRDALNLPPLIFVCLIVETLEIMKGIKFTIFHHLEKIYPAIFLPCLFFLWLYAISFKKPESHDLYPFSSYYIVPIFTNLNSP